MFDIDTEVSISRWTKQKRCRSIVETGVSKLLWDTKAQNDPRRSKRFRRSKFRQRNQQKQAVADDPDDSRRFRWRSKTIRAIQTIQTIRRRFKTIQYDPIRFTTQQKKDLNDLPKSQSNNPIYIEQILQLRWQLHTGGRLRPWDCNQKVQVLGGKPLLRLLRP